jgi:predicted CxxxxCH...CXXCH cytochrome family protein
MECVACHKKDDDKAHQGKMGDKCVSCHTAQNWEPNNFYHDVTGFKLEGSHKQVACNNCHKAKGIYTGLGPECTKCHTDPHLNQFGPVACGDCHTAKNWYPEKFNHGFVGFRLEGGHRAAACERCHVNRTYRNTTNNCYNCHVTAFFSAQAAPFHTSGNTNCIMCHKVYGWAPAQFFHKTMTFTGMHAVIKGTCSNCHSNTTNYTTNLKWAGATLETQCSNCHASSLGANAATPSVLTAHPAATTTCPNACDLCHNTTSFKGVPSSFPTCKPGRSAR